MVYKCSILSLPRFGTAFAARTETVLYPYTVLVINRCASTHFGENQLAPSSIGISPLTATHLTIFKDRRVRTFTWCYPSFILVTVRSPGFGSIKSDLLTLFLKLAFAWASEISLTTPLPISRRLILLQARGQCKHLPPLVRLRFHMLFHSP